MERPAVSPPPGHDIDDAGRQAFGDQLGHFQRRDRGRFGRLVDHGIADGDRRRDLAEEHVDREIPRPDDADDAERFAIVEAQDIAGIDRLAFERAAHPGVIAQAIDGGQDIGLALAPCLAGIGGLEPGEAVGVGLQTVGKLVDRFGALARSRAMPGRPCRFRRNHRFDHVAFARIRHGAKHVTGERASGFQRRVRRRLVPLVIDKEIVALGDRIHDVTSNLTTDAHWRRRSRCPEVRLPFAPDRPSRPRPDAGRRGRSVARWISTICATPVAPTG